MSIQKLDYCYAVLGIKDRGLTAEAKYFLIRVLFLYRHPFEVNRTVLELEKQMGMSDSVLKKARDLLFEKNYLVSLLDSKTNPSSTKGRPRMSFKLSESFISHLEKTSWAGENQNRRIWEHRFQVEKLLFWQTDQEYRRTKQLHKNTTRSLRPAARVVLAALYSHADECGAVRGLGLSELAQLSGMLKDRLDSHLDTLAKSGYILSRVAGITGRFLFGRSSGAFFLNAFNKGLCGYNDSMVLILINTVHRDRYNARFWGGRVFSESQNKGGYLFYFARSHNNSKQVNASSKDELKSIESTYVPRQGNIVPRDELQNLNNALASIRQYFSEQRVFPHVYLNDGTLKHVKQISDLCECIMNSDNIFAWALEFREFKLHEFFKDNPRPIFALFLQYKIQEYASILLSQYWDSLKFESMEIPNGLIEKIKLDIYPERLWKSTDDKEKSPLIAMALALFIYRISLEVALLAKSMVMHTFKDQGKIVSQLNNASYSILPFNPPKGEYKDWYHANNLTVVIRMPNMSVRNRCVVIEAKATNPAEQVKFEEKEHPDIRAISNEILAHFGLKNPEANDSSEKFSANLN